MGVESVQKEGGTLHLYPQRVAATEVAYSQVIQIGIMLNYSEYLL
jgi:hypothetical protein